MNRLQRGPPSYRNRRAPGQWSWDDFNPKSRPEKRLGSSNADSVEAYETNLCNGWNSQALSLFPDTKCRILQIDVLPEKFEVYSETATLSKQSPDPDRMRLGKYLFIDRLSKGVLEGLGAKYNIDVDYFRACFDLSVSHSVDVSRTNVSKNRNPLSPGDGDNGIPPSPVEGENGTPPLPVEGRKEVYLDLSGPNQIEGNNGNPSSGTGTRKDKREQEHIRITLPFLRSRIIEGTKRSLDIWSPSEDLALDLLGLYMIRSGQESTVVVYYPPFDDNTTTPLQEHFNWTARMGQEAYWKDILEHADDSTFLIFPVLWWVVYAWSDALEALYLYLDGLEIKVLESPSVQLTQEFHRIRICLLNYKALLEDFHKTIGFIANLVTQPQQLVIRGHAINRLSINAHTVHMPVIYPDHPDDKGAPETQNFTEWRFERECSDMDAEAIRLRQGVEDRNERIKDIMNMVFSRVTIQDSTAMKQISWITMFFIPATFVAGVFGMNVSGIGTDVTSLLNYVETAVPFTIVTIWILLALLPESQAGKPVLERFSWPLVFLWQAIRKLIPIQNKGKESKDVLPRSTRQ